MSSRIEGFNRYEGVIFLDTTEANQESVDKFKNALKKLISEYIPTTSIKEPEITYNESKKGELVAIYAYDYRDFENEKKIEIFDKVYLAKTGEDLIYIFVYLTLDKNNLSTIKVKR